MRAYKILSDGQSPFTGRRWPLPPDAHAGEWAYASGPLGLCTNGIHAADTNQLPHWPGAELWEIELDGEILTHEAALIASGRGSPAGSTRGIRRCANTTPGSA